MNSVPIDHLLSVTKNFITDFYHGNTGAVYPLLHPDVLWIGAADNQYIQGYHPVRAYWENLFAELPGCVIENIELDIIYYDGSLGIITGHYTGYTRPESKTVLAASQRLTFVWKRNADAWKILHMHISNPLEFQKKKELFPNAAGDLTYRYVQRLLQNQGAHMDTLQFHGKNAEVYFVFPQDICYIEANNIYSILHTLKNPLTICQSIGSLLSILPEDFIRVHRSFVINKRYVTEIKRYTIRLKNDIVLPIPEKRYKTIIASLLN